MSLMYIVNKIGPRIEPWGTPLQGRFSWRTFLFLDFFYV